MGYKTIDALMRHLRDNGISISGSTEKRQLINTGYYHGYKGYRFFGKTHTMLPAHSYHDIYATIEYDSKLKALFYPKIMYIETAIKSIALESILKSINSESIQTMFDKIVSSYNNSPSATSEKNKIKNQNDKLQLQNNIRSTLAYAYNQGHSIISHFYNNKNYSEVPLWALFEILTMGDFGKLLQCLTYDARDNISKSLGLNVSCDTKRELIYKYIYTLKDLRNAVAHNSVVFDTRFRNIDISKPMQECLKIEIGLPYVNFKTIEDYVILMCYYLKLINYSKKEIQRFINEFERITQEYCKSVDAAVGEMVVHPDLGDKLKKLKDYIKRNP